MDILKQLNWRYAVKQFNNDRLISEEKLDILLNAFNLTATSYGLQPLKLLVIQNKALQNNLVEHSMNQKQVAQASHVLVFCIETKIDKAFIENYFNLTQELRNTPDDIINPFKTFLIQDFSNKSSEELNSWATKQAYLAMGNLLTVCALEEIDACPMEGFIPEKYDEILDLESKGLKSVLIMPIGYRHEDDFMAKLEKVRKPLDDSIILL